jgi:glycosyltransferase involved in cell wall biosynthesis
MKILFDHASPFMLAHGGFQIQIEETKRALERLGVSIEHLRWWDAEQRGDIIHFFGVAPVGYIEQVRQKSLKVIQTVLLTETCNRTDLRLKTQGLITKTLLSLPIATGVKRQLSWKSFLLCDMNVVGLKAERQVLELVYGVFPERISILPLGLSQEFLAAGPTTSRGDFLINAGTVTARKNTVLLARMARGVQVPILFVGKPYGESDPYWIEFAALIDNRWVRHHPHVKDSTELINLYHSARGSVVMSNYENWCLVAHEAAACGLPLLLPKQKWSLERFGTEASYFSGHGFESAASELRAFYDRSLTAPAPRIKLYSWDEVAKQLKRIYEELLSTSA